MLKITLKQIIDDNYNFILTPEILKHYKVMQQDNQLFEFIRQITKDESQHIKDIVFVDCTGYKSRQKELERILTKGFMINNVRYVMGEKSASMSRQSMLSFVRESISKELNKKITNGIEMDKTVLAKYLAYRGLTMTSSFSLGDYKPYVIIVDDFKKIIPNQKIKRVDVVKKTFQNKDSETITYTERVIVDDIRDIEIEPFDGFGIHAKRVSEKIKEIIGIKGNPTTFMWRNAYFKGLTSEIDFVQYCTEKGIFEIQDIYGEYHSIYAIDIIATKSMFKGYNYYRKYGDYRDWQYYLDQCKENGYTWRIVKWNYSVDEEAVYTKNNYQNLQCLDLPYDKFATLADYSKNWVESIINGDPINTYSFLGLMADNLKPSSVHMKAILKNPEMLKDPMTKKFLYKLLKKNIDKMKCGKLYTKGAFRIAIPDIIAFLEYITGQEVNGVLESNEFFTMSRDGVWEGKYALFRNPHISSRENVVLNAVKHPELIKYAGHLENICMVNAKSLIMATLNGLDFDGDEILVVDNELIVNSIDPNMIIVMDIDNKVSAMQEEITHENIVKNTIMSFTSMVGEFSNYATCYHNKMPKTDEQKKSYQDKIDLLSVLTGKSIDYAKTGVLWFAPKSITKYAKPFPYFMRYVSQYYARQKRLSHAPSNLNLLAKDLEKWERKLMSKLKDDDFDYSIMMDKTLEFNYEKYNKIQELYKEYLSEFKELKKQQRMKYNSPEYYNYFSGYNVEDIKYTEIDWNNFFEKYKKMAKKICNNQKELANYVVELCYNPKNKNNDKSFAWVVAEDGILENIQPVEIKLPKYDPNGEYEYLGKRYTLVSYLYGDENFEFCNEGGELAQDDEDTYL